MRTETILPPSRRHLCSLKYAKHRTKLLNKSGVIRLKRRLTSCAGCCRLYLSRLPVTQAKARTGEAPVLGAASEVQPELVRGTASSETLSSRFFLVLFRLEARR